MGDIHPERLTGHEGPAGARPSGEKRVEAANAAEAARTSNSLSQAAFLPWQSTGQAGDTDRWRVTQLSANGWRLRLLSGSRGWSRIIVMQDKGVGVFAEFALCALHLRGGDLRPFA